MMRSIPPLPRWDDNPSQASPLYQACGLVPDSSLVPIYSWVKRGTVKVKWFAQEHNILTQPGDSRLHFFKQSIACQPLGHHVSFNINATYMYHTLTCGSGVKINTSSGCWAGGTTGNVSHTHCSDCMHGRNTKLCLGVSCVGLSTEQDKLG